MDNHKTGPKVDQKSTLGLSYNLNKPFNNPKGIDICLQPPYQKEINKYGFFPLSHPPLWSHSILFLFLNTSLIIVFVYHRIENYIGEVTYFLTSSDVYMLKTHCSYV